jgi:hypothetical protein
MDAAREAPHEEAPETITVEDIDLPQHDPRYAKVKAAEGVALRLVGYFGRALAAVAVGGLVVLGLGLFLEVELGAGAGGPPMLVQIVDSYSRLLAAIASFAATVFGPILGFILGHYFGRQEGKAS